MVDAKKVIEAVSKLVREKHFAEAKRLLLEALGGASGDPQTEELLLVELIELDCLTEPPNLQEAEEFALRREQLRGDAYGKLQSACLLYRNERSPAVLVSKLREAIELGRVQNDPKTVYTSLALLGKTFLDQGNTPEALATLDEIERMAAAKERFVVGDETWFLESLRARGLESDRVARLAKSLAPLCRDPAFKKRLEALATRA
jgi:hypothetical protein